MPVPKMDVYKWGISQWFLWGRKLGKEYWKFQPISDTKYWGYLRNLPRFGANKISLEMGGDGTEIQNVLDGPYFIQISENEITIVSRKQTFIIKLVRMA